MTNRITAALRFLPNFLAPVFLVSIFFTSILLAPIPAWSQEAATARKVLVKVAPQYSPLARSLAIEGTVKADVIVAPNGTMKSVEFKGGHPLFVQAARNALSHWRWEAGPRETHETVELKFAL
jgi:outer membrane biosynthesis protein TonB